MILIYLLLTAAIAVTLLWIGVTIYINSSSVKDFDISTLKGKKVLAIFAHPDDEALTCSGTLSRLARIADVQLVILTKGERGQAGMKLNNELKDVREKELANSASLIGLTKTIQVDLGDNELKQKKSDVRLELQKILKQDEPDIVITHDLSGLYGHPDHIVTSELITEFQQVNKYDIWYITLPANVVKMLKQDEVNQGLPVADIRVTTVWQLLMKIRIVNGYKSQRYSLTGSFPLKFIPWWFYVSLGTFEYFSVKEKRY